MAVMRKLINWCDKQLDEAIHEDDTNKAYVKSFASGFVEGAADAAVVMYVPVLIACYVWQNKATKK